MLTLASHVKCCLSDEHVLLLDLRRGRYLGVPGTTARLLRRLIDGLPYPDAGSEEAAAHASIISTAGYSEDEVFREMQAAGMLSCGTVGTDIHSNSSALPPGEPLIHGYEIVRAPVTPLHVTNFLLSCTIAKTLLRWFSMETLSARLHRRRNELPLAPVDSERLRELVAIFFRLRPLLYTSYEACLFNSLALHEFLVRYGLRTQFIIGVTAKPFKAHCWLQIGATVVNDTPSDIWRYTPILVR